MKRSPAQTLKDPRVILGEITAIGLVCSVGATLPLFVNLPHLHENRPALAFWLHLFGLDNLMGSFWFLAPLVLACASLSMVLLQQIRRVIQTWSRGMRPEQFQAAFFRAEFERPARKSISVGGPVSDGTAPTGDSGRSFVEIRTRGRGAMLGSPVFHTGLLMVVAAGVVRALFGADAVVDLVEGETLRTGSQVWNGQWPGCLAKPVALKDPVTLTKVTPAFYPDGGLKGLSATFATPGPDKPGNIQVAVNRGFSVDGAHLHVGSDFGSAAMLGWPDGRGGMSWEAVLMTDWGKRVFKGESTTHDGLRAYVLAVVDADGSPANNAEIRIMKGAALASAATLRSGQSVTLSDGTKVTLGGLPFWIRLNGSRDPSVPLVYSGFTLILLGACIMFLVIRTDTCVTVTPDGERERVFVALRAQRFAPLYREKFERLVQQQGGMA